MIVLTRPALARACQLARSGCESLDEIQERLSHEGFDRRELAWDVEVRRMLRALMRQARVSSAKPIEHTGDSVF